MTYLRPAITLTVLMTLLLGLAYPLAMTGLAHALFPHQADGSLLARDGRVVGSALVGQAFAAPQYLAGRPSAVGYDAAASGSSNLAPTSAARVAAMRARAAAFEAANGEKPTADLVTASASGLDPHISPAAAEAQVNRIAAARGVAPGEVRALLRARVERPFLGFVGEPVVNVLLANLALDAAFPLPAPPAAAPAPAAAAHRPAHG